MSTTDHSDCPPECPERAPAAPAEPDAQAVPATAEPVDHLELARLAMRNFRRWTEHAEQLIAKGEMWPGRSKELRALQDGAISQARTAALVSIAESLAAFVELLQAEAASEAP